MRCRPRREHAPLFWEFPAYALGRNPNLRVVACSYSATLALQFSRDVQLITHEQNYARLFPESIIPGFATKHNAAARSQGYDLTPPGLRPWWHP